MSIKQSTLEGKWYYRVAKVLALTLPSVAMLLVVIYNIQQKNLNQIIYAIVTLIAFLLILKIIWRIFLYIVFGGLENDIKKKDNKITQSPAGEAAQPTVPTPSSSLSEEDKKQIGFYVGCLVIIAVIYYAYFIWEPSIPNPNDGGNRGSKCISTGCGSLWRCDGTYYDSNGVQRTLHACLSRKAGETYSSWSGNCRQCP